MNTPSKRTVAVVDYGMGNLRSVSQAVMHVARGTGVDVIVTSKPDEVYAAERIVLPGQGAMPDCMRELRDSGLQDAVLHAACAVEPVRLLDLLLAELPLKQAVALAARISGAPRNALYEHALKRRDAGADGH